MGDDNLPVAKKEYESVLDLVTDVNENDVIIESRCKLCKWEHRIEAEEYWDSKRRQHSVVVRFCADRGFKIDDKSVANHMYKHFLRQQRKLAVKDYAEKLKAYEAIKADRLQNLAVSRAVLLKELLEIGEQSDQLDLHERRRNAETLIKLVAQITALDESEKKFYDDWKPAKIVIEKLTQIVQFEAENATPDMKQLMARVVETLYSSVDGIKLDK